MPPPTTTTATSGVMPSLPAGFRFHPTDEELIVHYLMNQAAAVPCPAPIIAEVDIYRCNPWDLPRKALFGEKEWYFFSPRERKYPNGARPNRAAGSGYWKATGTDKPVSVVGVKKALVFYSGKPPRGAKTDWVMHEYRLITNTKRPRPTAAAAAAAAGSSSSSPSSMRLDDWVLCRIYNKSNNNDFVRFSDHDHHDEQGSTVQDEQGSSLNNNNSMSMSVSMTKSCSLTDLLNTIDDFPALSQLLLLLDNDDAAALPAETEPQQSPLLTYTTTSTPAACQPPLNNVHLHVHDDDGNSMDMPPRGDDVDASLCSDYGGGGATASYGSLKRERTVVVTGDDGDDDGGASSSFGDGSSSLKKRRKLHLPSEVSRSGALFGSSSGYCNVPQLAEASGSSSFQYSSSSSLLSHPFVNQHKLLQLDNHHLEMQ